MNRRWAERTGQQEADRQVEQQAAERRAFLRRQAEERQRDALHGDTRAVEAEATDDARRQLAEQSEQLRARLSRQAEERLDDIHRETLQGVFRTVAVGYQQALLSYARQHGAEHISVVDNDGVIEIQFEMEA
jgi:hypothetical protein